MRGFPELQAERLAARRQAALAAVRAAAARAEAEGARLIVFGSLAGAARRFHARSDIDVALDGDAARVLKLWPEIWCDLNGAGFEADVVSLPHAPACLIERIREDGREPRDLV